MGFASKMAMGFSTKGKELDDTVLASPDTQFGPGVLAAAPPIPAAPPPIQSADEAALRLGNFGNVVRRKQRAAEAAASEDADLRLPLIGHLSLPRQLRLLLVAAVVGIALTRLRVTR
jgi:twitching motility protein PilJ